MSSNHPRAFEVAIVAAIAIVAIVAFHISSLKKHEHIAYSAYRRSIGCREADAMRAAGDLPPGLAKPSSSVLDRCYGKNLGYSDVDEYYSEDKKNFSVALDELGW